MNYNNDLGLIDTILTLDTTEAPPLGGQTNVLVVLGSGAITLPGGITADQPVPAAPGMLRYNNGGYLEFYDGITSSWQTLSYASGSVASVSLNTVTGADSAIITTTPTTSTTGAVAETITFNTQLANYVFAGPTTGTAQPTFRALVAADIPPVTNIAGGTAGDIIYQTGTNTTGFISPGTTNYALVSNGTGVAPTYQAIVNSFSAGTTGFTPSTTTTGAITLAGILSLANGGTNANNAGSDGSIMYNNGTQIVNSTVGTLGQLLTSSGAGAPTWTSTSSTLTTSGTVLISGAGGTFTANGATFTGSPTFSGVTLSGTPTAATDAVTKAYADSLSSGLSWKQAVLAGTTLDLGLVTYVNGAAGVGATLTNADTQAAFTIDGVTPTVGSRVLIKNQADETQNGIYTVTDTGSGATNWVLTRSLDNNIGTEMDGAAVFIEEGTVNATTSWVQSTFPPITIGTSNIVWVQFSGQGTYSAGSGLLLTGTQFSVKTDGTTTYINGSGQVAVDSSATTGQVLLSNGTAGTTATWGAVSLGNASAVTGTLGVVNGGTGNTSFTVDGVLYGNGTSAIQSTAAGTNGQVLTVTGGVPAWGTSAVSLAADATTGTVSLGGTLTIDGTTNRITTAVSGASYAIDISAAYIGQSSITTLGTVTTGTWNATTIGATYGGTGQTSYTTGDTLYASNSTTLSKLPIGTAGQILTVVSGVPAWTTISTEAVTTFQTSLSGLTPSTPTNGAVTLAGTLGVASGGTGDTSLTSNGVLFGNGTSPVGVTSAGAQYNVLTVNGSGIPVFGTIDLSQSTAVGTSIIQPANGGTGVANANTSTITLGGSFTTTPSNNITLTTTGATNVTLPTTGTLLTAADAVTSFDLTDTSTTPIYTTSPLTPTVGAVASTITLNTQSANLVFAGPATGAAAEPTFRTLVYADVVGAALKLYAENPVTPVAPSATGTNAIALGSGALSSQYGGVVHANGNFTGPGDAQGGNYIFRNSTTNATATELFLDGSSTEFILPVNSVVTFSMLISARRTDTTGFGGGFKVEGVAHRDATVASAALIGATSTTIIGRTVPGLTVSVTANTATGALKISVTGVAASTYRWVAVMNTSEVTN